jgi:hypothetical protein
LITATLIIPAWAGTSANYRIVTEVLDSGAIGGQSVSYSLLGKTRDREMQVPASVNYRIGEGFLRSVYFARIIFAPIVTAVSPPSAQNAGAVPVTVTGANFVPGAAVKLSLSGQPDIVGSSVVVADSGKITCTLDLTGAKAGLWAATVTNPDGRSGTLPSAFKVIYLPPTVTSVVPDKANNTEKVSVTINGGNFKAGASVKLSKAGETDIAGESVTVVSAEKITCAFDLKQKTVGPWDLVVTNEDGQSKTLSSAFKVEAADLEIKGPIANSPNPFNPRKQPTAISYVLTKDSDINIDIFNMRGERVWHYRAPAGAQGGIVGKNVVEWDGMTAFKASASEGVYFLYISGTVKGQSKMLGKTKMAVIK